MAESEEREGYRVTMMAEKGEHVYVLCACHVTSCFAVLICAVEAIDCSR